jgi:hypothetical protein
MKPATFGTQSGMDGMRKKVFLKKISQGKNHKQMVEIKSAMVERVCQVLTLLRISKFYFRKSSVYLRSPAK